MSTAEQIIAEHRWDERRGICECMFVPEFGPGTRYERMTVQEWAAHVVAALTNAGKTIVELPEADGTWWDGVSWTGDGFEIALDSAGDLWVKTDNPWMSPERLRALSVRGLAAARVAEGGDQP
ncbi:hypothetical protein GS445_01975 [Rhodococcus hoagii]|uniref:hypothetical protein n=1 Tax=Rhodococcus hoagii TaxID=43767 RepID=UPI00197F4A72|nr:hypothetical protein [Prescottella equi]MBM4512205.1 hypothetical protein [Prescottella equi]MBM4548525.1 hypothetical protein [Prescottella equi]MBM4710893.1 hypothetical protein [Prescottella equi]MBP0086121.1 hypothetical protein [Prescottella equi]NKT29911.1 hypothetical protein [Prescottella equi]